MASPSDLKRRLFAGEHELRSLGGLTLTTHRVIVHARGLLRQTSTAVALRHVQWTRLERTERSLPVSATLATGLLAVLAAVLGVVEPLWPMAFAALAGGLSWAQRGRTRLVIGAGSVRLVLPLGTAPQRRLQARDLADAIEQAAARVGLARGVIDAR